MSYLFQTQIHSLEKLHKSNMKHHELPLIPITVSPFKACVLMGISKATFYRRQKMRNAAVKAINAGDNQEKYNHILKFPPLLKDGEGARGYVRYDDIVSWSLQLHVEEASQ